MTNTQSQTRDETDERPKRNKNNLNDITITDKRYGISLISEAPALKNK